jgi:hypothetical protein
MLSGPVWTIWSENIWPYRDSNLDPSFGRPACRQSLYRLRYRGSGMICRREQTSASLPESKTDTSDRMQPKWPCQTIRKHARVIYDVTVTADREGGSKGEGAPVTMACRRDDVMNGALHILSGLGRKKPTCPVPGTPAKLSSPPPSKSPTTRFQRNVLHRWNDALGNTAMIVLSSAVHWLQAGSPDNGCSDGLVPLRHYTTCFVMCTASVV